MIEIALDKLEKAQWNYKENDEDLSEKLKENIKRNGQLENLVVREIEGGKYEIVNGNHRLDVLKALNLKKAYCFNLGNIKVNQAKRIAIELNETRFKTNDATFAAIIKELSTDFDLSEMASTMPFEAFELEAFCKLTDPDWMKTLERTPAEATEDGDGVTLSIKLTADEAADWSELKDKTGIEDDHALLLQLIQSFDVDEVAGEEDTEAVR